MRRRGRVVFFGELLMRLETKRYERFLQAAEFRVGYTGAEANVAVSLANYGLETYVVSAVPETEIGQACINHIRQYGVRTEHIRRSGRRLGTFYLETGVSQRPSKVIYDLRPRREFHHRTAPRRHSLGGDLRGQGLVPFFGHRPGPGRQCG
jgi:sugar/nucleoside kinase (ribokinase family)